MKKLLYGFLLTLLTTGFIISCKDDDNSTSVIGKWNIVREDEGDGWESTPGDYMVFKENGSFAFGDGDGEYWKGLYVLNAPANTLSISDPEEGTIDHFDIAKLTSSELVLNGKGAEVWMLELSRGN